MLKCCVTADTQRRGFQFGVEVGGVIEYRERRHLGWALLKKTFLNVYNVKYKSSDRCFSDD